MKILFYLSHPAHFHLFKNVIVALKKSKHKVYVLIKKKDVLEELLIDSNIDYKNILSKERKNNLFSAGLGLLKEDIKVLLYCFNKKINVLVGTSPVISHIGFILRKRSLIVNEDDANVVPLLAYAAYPFATSIVTPNTCKNGKWENKSIKYNGYHELAYLHPNYFKPDISICKMYVDIKKPYFIMRFSKLGAHHDKGVRGLNNNIAIKLIRKLQSHGRIIITSERKLNKELEKFRISIKPTYMHHLMAFSSLYIGDSQTMAAEAGMLGVPFIRYNDFIGKIGYLKELEDKYELGYGIISGDVEKLFSKIDYILKTKNRKKLYIDRRDKMLAEKIDVNKFLEKVIISS